MPTTELSPQGKSEISGQINKNWLEVFPPVFVKDVPGFSHDVTTVNAVYEEVRYQ